MGNTFVNYTENTILNYLGSVIKNKSILGLDSNGKTWKFRIMPFHLKVVEAFCETHGFNMKELDADTFDGSKEIIVQKIDQSNLYRKYVILFFIVITISVLIYSIIYIM